MDNNIVVYWKMLFVFHKLDISFIRCLGCDLLAFIFKLMFNIPNSGFYPYLLLVDGVCYLVNTKYIIKYYTRSDQHKSTSDSDQSPNNGNTVTPTFTQPLELKLNIGE